MGTPQREAVVFILDSFPSMQQAYDPLLSNGDVKPPTRLFAAKKVIESYLFDMMLNSHKGSLAAIIVTKTRKTKHHMKKLRGDPNNSIFPNLTALCYAEWVADGQCMRFPSARLVQEMWKVTPVDSLEEASRLQGDICDALILAADTMYQMTRTPKTNKPASFQRKIVMLTDAGHPVVLDMPQIMVIIDGLRFLNECPLHVLGIRFQRSSVEFETPLDPSAAKPIKEEPGQEKKRIKPDPDDDDALVHHWEEEPVPDGAPSHNPDVVIYATVEDRERLLASIAEKTGGSVLSIQSMQALLDAKAGQRMRKVTRSKTRLHVGPGLTVAVYSIKLLGERKPLSVKQYILGSMDDGGKMEEVKRVSSYWHRKKEEVGPDQEDDKDDEVQAEKIGDAIYADVQQEEWTEAIRYGKDLIPMGEVDKAGLTLDFGCGYEDETYNPADKNIRIIGYTRRDSVHHLHLMGPPYMISGGDCTRACTILAALARSLHKPNYVAICSFKVSGSGVPSLAALYPFEGDTQNPPNRLMLFKLPFADDVKQFSSLPAFSDILEDEEGEEDEQAARTKASDDLVDALMLESDALRYEKIQSPYRSSFNMTILRRAIEGDAKGIVNVQIRGDPTDKMMTPHTLLEKAKPVLNEFRQAFPLVKKKIKKSALGGKKKGASTYADHLDE